MRRLKPYGPRGVALIAASVLAFGRALTYLQPASPDYTPRILEQLAGVVPIQVYGILWAAVGTHTLIAAFRVRQGLALTFMASLCFLWSLIYVWQASTRTSVVGIQEAASSWITATVYIAFAVFLLCMGRMLNVPSEVAARAVNGRGTDE